VTRDPKFGTKKFSVCHWDTFDNETITVGGADTLEEATAFVEKRYGDRLRNSGADRVEIVDSSGKVVRSWSVG
jgi:hypothetical protein